MKKSLKKKKNQGTEELHAFENMSVSHSGKECFNVSSSEEGGSDDSIILNLKHSSK